jgi:hypothetical protein
MLTWEFKLMSIAGSLTAEELSKNALNELVSGWVDWVISVLWTPVKSVSETRSTFG